VDVPLAEDQNGNEIKSAVVEWAGVSTVVTNMTKQSLKTLQMQARFLGTYEKLADAVEKTRGHDGKLVKKVRVDAIRDELEKNGWLTRDEKGHLTSTAKSDFKRAREATLESSVMVQEHDLIWRISLF
jgi:hypothetical protein